METPVGVAIDEQSAIALGRDYWERQYANAICMREELVNSVLVNCADMETREILEDFAHAQVREFFTLYRQWIDKTFPS